MSDVEPIPDGFHTLAPHLVVHDAAAAIEFYRRAFGALELFRIASPDGKLILYSELQVGESRLMLCDEVPDSDRWRPPKSLGGTSVTIHFWTDDCDAAFRRAVDAGAEVSMPLMDAFWGDRYGKVTDPFGHEWAIATHTKDLTPMEITDAVADAFSKS
ncbi:MAG: VOC family protein [Planctomycetota bacterium]|nr:VOC family protein [Planctomycetota bacterium]